METEVVNCPSCNGEVTVEKTDFFESHICEHCLNYVKIVDLPSCCTRPNYHPVKFTTLSFTIQVREQCKYCGNLKGNALGGFSKEQREAMPPADIGKRNRRDEYINGQQKRLYQRRSEIQKEKYEKSREEKLIEYNQYLKSPEWQAKRYLVLQRDNYECQACLCKKATQVHHKSYEFCDLKGNEPCFDLVAVCLQCHNKIEEMKKQKRLIAKQ